LRTSFTFTHADHAIASRITRAHFAVGHTGTIDVVVDLSVAIFIRSVARFGHFSAGRTGGNHSIDATVDHHRTCAFAARNRREVFVELPIAVIVELIANFVDR